MKSWYLLVWLIFRIDIGFSAIAVTKVIVRIPKPNDIGLIFDLSLCNKETDVKEMLQYRIHSAGTCSINLTDSESMDNAGRVVGGNFGHIDVDANDVVSLIWPTVSLYNRVGSCPIIITSTNPQGAEAHQEHQLNFDTRFPTLDPDGHTLTKSPDYMDCKNWDKEYLKNCTPVCCEERYFGQRNYYNEDTEHCEEVPRCDMPNMHYDFYSNECFNPDDFFTDIDMKKIQNGDFITEGEVEQPVEQIEENKTSENKDTNPSNLIGNFPVYQYNSKKAHANAKRASDAFDDEFNSYLQPKQSDANNTNQAVSAAIADTVKPRSIMPCWLKGLLEGFLIVGAILLLQVLATIAIYLLICFVIFLVVTWVCRRRKCSSAMVCALRSPSASEVRTSTCCSSSTRK